MDLQGKNVLFCILKMFPFVPTKKRTFESKHMIYDLVRTADNSPFLNIFFELGIFSIISEMIRLEISVSG